MASKKQTPILAAFARHYARFKDAARRSQQLSNNTGRVCAVAVINDLPRCAT